MILRLLRRLLPQRPRCERCAEDPSGKCATCYFRDVL
jgi:hypothetical protein